MEWVGVKSGWLYERKKGGLLHRSKMVPRWVVVYSEPVPAIGLYEQRSDAMAPYAPLKYIDLPLEETQILCTGNTATTTISGDSRRSSIMTGSIMNGLFGNSTTEGGGCCQFTVKRPGINITLIAKDGGEREEWIFAIKQVLLSTNFKKEFSSSKSVSVESVVSSHDDGEGIRCGGLVVLEGKIVSRIRTGHHQITIEDTKGDNVDGDDDDSIVGSVHKSLTLLDKPVSECKIKYKRQLIICLVEEINWKYQQAQMERSKSSDQETILKCDLQMMREQGQFTALAIKRLKKIVDGYHHESGVGGGSRFEDGPLRILFITDYTMGDEEVVINAYEWLRQELNASRWISSINKVSIHQQMMTVIEYKGFRALAMLALPLSNATLIDDSAVILSELMREMNIQNILTSTSVEVHQVKQQLQMNHHQWEKVGKKVAKTPHGIYFSNVHDLIPSFTEGDASGKERFFRQEFVQSLPFIISSLTGGGGGDLQRTLKEERVYDFLKELEGLDLMPLDGNDWRQMMHERGLNMNLLGLIAEMTTLPHIREGAIIEMISRTAKKILRSRIRNAILHFREIRAVRVEEELAEIVIDMLHNIVLSEVTGTGVSGSGWVKEVIGAAQEHYNYKDLDLNMVRQCSKNSMILSICQHCGIKLKENSRINHLLKISDLDGFEAKICGSIYFCNNLEISEDLMELSKAILPFGSAVWESSVLRSNMAREAYENVNKMIVENRWEEGMRMAELALGICPKQHPLGILIHTSVLTIKTFGPQTLAWRLPSLMNFNTNTLEVGKSLISKVAKHFGEVHPLGIEVRVRIATLLEVKDADMKGEALALRLEALNVSIKVLGRRHGQSKKLICDLAEANRVMERFDDAIRWYTDALKFYNEEDEIKQKIVIMLGLAKCWQAKGDYDTALEWATKCVSTEFFWEETLLLIASLSQTIYEGDRTTNPISILLSEEIIPESVGKHLNVALECYSKIFEVYRGRADPGETGKLMAYLKEIVQLKLRLAQPAARTFVKAAIRKRLFNKGGVRDGGEKVREMMVRMVAGTEAPVEVVERVLGKAGLVGGIEECEGELMLFLDIVDLQ